MKLVQACQALVQSHQNVLEVANYLIFLVNFCAGTTKAVVESIQLCGTECDEYIQIFKYSNILVTNIYSDIRSFFFYEYIWTFVRVKFVCTNIFGHSLVSVLECKTKTNIRIYSNIHAIFNMNTNSDIRSCQKK